MKLVNYMCACSGPHDDDLIRHGDLFSRVDLSIETQTHWPY